MIPQLHVDESEDTGPQSAPDEQVGHLHGSLCHQCIKRMDECDKCGKSAVSGQ